MPPYVVNISSGESTFFSLISTNSLHYSRLIRFNFQILCDLTLYDVINSGLLAHFFLVSSSSAFVFPDFLPFTPCFSLFSPAFSMNSSILCYDYFYIGLNNFCYITRSLSSRSYIIHYIFLISFSLKSRENGYFRGLNKSIKSCFK